MFEGCGTSLPATTGAEAKGSRTARQRDGRTLHCKLNKRINDIFIQIGSFPEGVCHCMCVRERGRKTTVGQETNGLAGRDGVTSAWTLKTGTALYANLTQTSLNMK